MNDSSVSDTRYPSGTSKILVQAIWITGLVLPSLTGLLAIGILQSRGISTVSLSRGFALIVPLTLFVEIPFAILAWVMHQIFKNVPADDRGLWMGWNIVSAGALFGLVVAVMSCIIEPMLYHGPGGFAEAVSMMMMLWMITLPVLLVWSIGGVIAGGFLGGLLALCLSFLCPQWFSGK
jgi:hypothetical protein